MEQALSLAERGRGTTAPNPMVGCLLVKGGQVVGEGWHRRAGEAHAEIRALAAAGEAACGATVYVTLEPCDHHGRTPPCTEALVRAGVDRVVVAALDPNPRVDGAGVRRLTEAGIEVVTGVLQAEAERQNQVFRTVQLRRRPFVLYKTAMTLDGKIATRTGQSRWITGEAARARVQEWRSEFEAVAVGINTLLLDDPLLTARVEGGRTPIKVIFDSLARTPPAARLFEPDASGVAARGRHLRHSRSGSGAGRWRGVDALRGRGAEVAEVAAVQGRPEIGSALNRLRECGVSSLLLEGGGTLAWSFFEADAVDRVAWFIGPKLLGGASASPLGGLGVTDLEAAIRLDIEATEVLAEDLLITGRVRCTRPEGSGRAAGEVEHVHGHR